MNERVGAPVLIGADPENGHAHTLHNDNRGICP
jgi:hypothetical protein